MKKHKISLLSYIESLQAGGRYVFTRNEALAILGVTSDGFRFAALRLMKKKRLMRPKQGFYVIVPTEYLAVGAPPATWFIDSLMKFYNQPYYVALLTAAAIEGAAHQQPQIFQVMTDKPLRAIKLERTYIAFFTKKIITPESCQSIKTPTGYMQVSVPEVTAFDLVRYIKPAGYLNHVATILGELQEKFDEQRFKFILTTEKLEPCDVQRLGYLLELVEANSTVTDLLKSWIKEYKPRAVLLRPDKDFDKTKKNSDWQLYINEKVETDL